VSMGCICHVLGRDVLFPSPRSNAETGGLMRIAVTRQLRGVNLGNEGYPDSDAHTQLRTRMREASRRRREPRNPENPTNTPRTHAPRDHPEGSTVGTTVLRVFRE
jgi:hypothetical protein